MPQKSPSLDSRTLAWLSTILYAAFIAAAVLFTAQYAFELLARTPEFAQAGDFFGYLQMASDLRAGHAPHDLPPYTFDSPHAHLLHDYLAAQHLQLDSYNAVLGPNAYHYQPRTGLIVNQYPPGIGWLLALFPRGRAYHIAATLTAVALLAFITGILALSILRGSKNAAASLAAPAFAGLAAIIGLRMFGISVSYSIDLFSLPILLTFTCIHFAMNRESKWALALAFLAGGFFGYAIACRLAAALFLPGFLILLWPGRTRVLSLAKPAAFLVTAFACGVLPLMLHQARLTGSPFVSTYATGDASIPSLGVAGPNLAYYSLGAGSLFMLVLLLAAACFYLLFFLSVRPATPGCGYILRQVEHSPAQGPGLNGQSAHCAIEDSRAAATPSPPENPLRRHAIAIPIFFLIPMLFFLTHAMTTDYYQLPTVLVCLYAMAFGVLGPPGNPPPRQSFWPAGVAAAAFALMIVWQLITLPNLPSAASMQPPPLALPAFLQNPNAWIFGDRYTGTLWYYHGIPSGMILPATPDARLKTYQFIFRRGDPLLILDDNPALAPILSELQQLGAQFQNAGSFGNEPVLQILWSPGGPKSP